MSSLLIVSQSQKFGDDLRSELRKAGYRIVLKEDIIEGLKELRWYQPKLIIWDMQPDNLKQMKGLLVLRQQYGHVKLLLALDKRSELTDELKQLCNGACSRNLEPAKITEKVVALAGKAVPVKPRVKFRDLDDED